MTSGVLPSATGTVELEASARSAKPRGRRRESALFFLARHSIAIAIAVCALAPIALIVLTSFMSANQSLTSNFWPTVWHPDNYVEVFRKLDMGRYLLNTIMYAGLATFFMLISSVPAAYALARLRWRGRNFMFLLIICMMLLPAQVTTVPLYLWWAHFGLTGSLWPLILPNLFGDAFSIFLLRQFMVTIPEEYLDAARVDGAGEWRTLLRVVIPMARPGIAATSMFMFFNCWNDYYGPYLFTSENQDHWTLSFALASFRGLHNVEWNYVMAATVITVVPIVVLFFFAQKAFTQGVTLTGVKG
jgi:multiple sugar transport system permease protein